MRVTNRIIHIFDKAAKLDKNKKLKNAVYCIEKDIFIFNHDHTVLLRFPLRDLELPFQNPIRFDANSYDSDEFEMRGDKICFIKREGDWVRTKSCKSPQFTPIKIRKIFNRIAKYNKPNNCVPLATDFLQCLEDDMSHIEFSGKNGELIAIQRDIYTGSLITITKKKKGKDIDEAEVVKDFLPIGIRTKDLLSLFTFVKRIHFYFYGKGAIWFESKNRKFPFTGIMSQGVYDELGRV